MCEEGTRGGEGVSLVVSLSPLFTSEGRKEE